MKTKSLSAVLLAGGESRRMGSDKATAIFRDRPLWRNQLRILQAVRPAEILVSARTDPEWRPAQTIFVADVEPSIGPLSGIVAALRHMAGTHLLVLAIDLPMMTSAYLQMLQDETKPGQGVVPVIGNRAEPIAAIYPAETNEFANAVAGVDHSLQTVVGELARANRVRLLPVAPQDEPLFQNVNSQSDLKALRR
ncbi:MAG TPA: molybdenum cofactor guanylyltransferase [Chthoniobacterales bacterium]|nr:molybdenum cofactor guanylyltransferase [Chthoniobacterales bacterium]